MFYLSACKTCFWNFSAQGKKSKGRVCANARYGEYISDILKDKDFICGSYRPTLKNWSKTR